jgi:cell division septum initiation protein DivIVA
MQRAYAQANELIEQATAQAQAILDNATEEANSIRYGAMQYTDDMLAKLQYIIEHSIKDNKEKYDSLLSGLENVLSVVNNNRNELSGIEENSAEEADDTESSDETDTQTDAE